jgi:hypothetical protein
MAGKFIDVVFKMDASKSEGTKGYLILEGIRKNG